MWIFYHSLCPIESNGTNLDLFFFLYFWRFISVCVAFFDSYSFVVCMFPLECVSREIYFDLSAFFVYFHGTCHLNISINSRYTHAISIISSNVSLFKLILTFIKFSIFLPFRRKKIYIFFRVQFNISTVSTELSQIELANAQWMWSRSRAGYNCKLIAAVNNEQIQNANEIDRSNSVPKERKILESRSTINGFRKRTQKEMSNILNAFSGKG